MPKGCTVPSLEMRRILCLSFTAIVATGNGKWDTGPSYMFYEVGHLTLIDRDRGKQYVLCTRDCRCSRGEAEGNIDSRGYRKHTAFPSSQSISILLYIKSQRNEKIKRTAYENT